MDSRKVYKKTHRRGHARLYTRVSFSHAALSSLEAYDALSAGKRASNASPSASEAYDAVVARFFFPNAMRAASRVTRAA